MSKLEEKNFQNKEHKSNIPICLITIVHLILVYLGRNFSFKRVSLNKTEFLLWSFFFSPYVVFMLQSWKSLIISPKDLFVFYWVLKYLSEPLSR